MSLFNLEYPLSKLKPASYNPRAISPDAISTLQASIRTLGPVRAVIVRSNDTIVAGHQRTKAMLGLDMTHAPAFILEGLNEADEVRFNQIHNAADIETADNRIRISVPLELGWSLVPASAIEVDQAPQKASQLGETLKLLTKFGEWGNAVVDETGRVLAAPIYAMACKILHKPLRVCVVPMKHAGDVLLFMGRNYGEFSYSHLPEQMWAQSFAQMKRLRDTGKARIIHSRAYETVVIPKISREMRILDFGAGQKDYVKKLQGEGYNIHGVEFYLRRDKSNDLNLAQVHRDIDKLCADLVEHGRYDMVICDSVLNSVTSLKAEQAVLGTINSLCRPDGMIVFSGRCSETVQRISEKRKRATGNTRDAWFFDRDGFTAMYQRGVWLFQKFHSLQQVRSLARRFIGPQYQVTDYTSQCKTHFSNTSWSAYGHKQVEVDPREAQTSLEFEFNLPLPGGSTYGRSQDVVQAWSKAIAAEQRREIAGSQIASSGK
jgi:ParB family transcriptional regulator, chromosome partitioning protein